MSFQILEEDEVKLANSSMSPSTVALYLLPLYCLLPLYSLESDGFIFYDFSRNQLFHSPLRMQKPSQCPEKNLSMIIRYTCEKKVSIADKCFFCGTAFCDTVLILNKI
jgi:hypothetical protein